MEAQTQRETQGSVDTRIAWAIDSAHSTIGFSVKHMMFTTVHGRFRGVTGEILLDIRRPHGAEVAVDIETATIDTGDPKRDEHLRSADFFDVATYPSIAFRSTSVEPLSPVSSDRWRVIGDLTIHGVTHVVELTAEQTGRGTNPWGAEVIGFEATGKISRKDYGMTFNVPLAEGGFLVGDEVKIAIDVQAARQASSN
jgi:polyisoprenoid-binding protein YceI